MKNYLLLFRVGPRFLTASPEELQQIMTRSKDWTAQIAKAGKLNGVVRLQRNGVVLKGTTKQRSDGPYADGKEIINGYLGIKARDLEEAIQIARGNPVFDYDGTLEIREVASN